MAEQSYSNPASRNVSIAAGKVGGNQTQGAGVLPNKVSVPLPGTDKTQPKDGGGMKKAPAGFNNGIINGKV